MGGSLCNDTKPFSQVGDSVIFHARSNFPLSEFHFVLYSHGQIVTSQQIKSNSGSRLVTFDAMATSEMTPSARGMIWMADRDGRVVSAETTLVVASQDKKAVSSIYQNWKSTHSPIYNKWPKSRKKHCGTFSLTRESTQAPGARMSVDHCSSERISKGGNQQAMHHA